MFKRDRKKALARRLREFVWPEMGWRRLWRYLRYRLLRLSGSPYAVAAGFASGAAVSFTPLVGFHMLLGVVVARLIGANMVAALFGTIVGNPWTFPFIWLWTYKLGIWLGVDPAGAADPGGRLNDLIPAIVDALLAFDLKYLAAEVWPIAAPMLAGGAVTGVVVWAVTYLSLKPVFEVYQNRRAARRSAKPSKVASHETEIAPRG